MRGDLPQKENLKQTENTEQHPILPEPVLKREEMEIISEAADKSRKEEKENYEKIYELKKGLESPEARQETKGEQELIAEKELEEISKLDLKPRDLAEKMRDFLKQKDLEEISVNLNIDHPVQNLLERFNHTYSGQTRFNFLAFYVFLNSYKETDRLNADIQRDKEKIDELKGITNIEKILLDDGRVAHIVKIDKKSWPSMNAAGATDPRLDVAFVPDGFSKDVTRAITDHEIYHLNNHTTRKLKRTMKESLLEESETLWHTGIKKNFVGQFIKMPIEFLINTPYVVKNVFRDFFRKK